MAVNIVSVKHHCRLVASICKVLLVFELDAISKLPPEQAAQMDQQLHELQELQTQLLQDIYPRLAETLRLIAANPDLQTAQLSLMAAAYDEIQLAARLQAASQRISSSLPDQTIAYKCACGPVPPSFLLESSFSFHLLVSRKFRFYLRSIYLFLMCIRSTLAFDSRRTT